MEATRWNRWLRYAALLLGTLAWNISVVKVNANTVDTDTAEVVVVVNTTPHTLSHVDDAIGEVRYLAIIDPAPERGMRVTALPKTGDGPYSGDALGSGEIVGVAAVLVVTVLVSQTTVQRRRGGLLEESRAKQGSLTL